jgi:hypothetical protein
VPVSLKDRRIDSGALVIAYRPHMVHHCRSFCAGKNAHARPASGSPQRVPKVGIEVGLELPALAIHPARCGAASHPAPAE